MRFRSFDELGLDPRRAFALVAAASSVFFGVSMLVGFELRLGSVSVLVALFAGAGAGYLLSTAPRRALKMAAFRQALDAPSLAAAANIYMRSTCSKAKTFLMLRAEEPLMESFLIDVRRRLLLGYDASYAVKAAGPEGHLFSESVRTVVGSVSGADRARVEEGADELDGMLASSGLEEETKLPMFIAVSFFLPIMMMLFAAMTKETGPAPMLALLVLELVVLDLAFSLSGSSVSWKENAP